MGNFKDYQKERSEGRSGRSSRFGGKSRGRDRDFGRGRNREETFGRNRDSRRRPQMHEVTCDKCGKECEVPFRPTGDKPVLCSDCFKNKGSGSESFNSSGASGISKEQFNELNSKLDKILEILNEIEVEYEDSEDGDSDEEEEEDSDEEEEESN